MALRRGLETLIEDRHLILVPLMQSALAEGLVAVGRPGEARGVIDSAMMTLGPAFASADSPEVLRVKGLVTAALGDAAGGEEFLLGALDLARRQSAISWELRTAMSLARVQQANGETPSPARLAALYGQFDEGYETEDVTAARLLIREISAVGSAPSASPGEG